jgi:hypothetical protein
LYLAVIVGGGGKFRPAYLSKTKRVAIVDNKNC